jgi:diguanylate cyclase (GGDEF)-like protein
MTLIKKTYDSLVALDQTLRFASVPVRYGLAIGLAAVIAVGDMETPAYILMTGYYFIPIGFSAWYCSRWVTTLLTTSSVAVNLYMISEVLPQSVGIGERLFVYSSFAIVLIGFSMVSIELRALVTRLNDESKSDPLTGLKNRRSFMADAEFELTRASRSKESVTVALLDLDNFKEVNDSQGHKVGDALLVAVSRNLSAAIREIDLLGRLGGDEFAILFPGTTEDESQLILSRILLGLKPLLSTFSGSVTASIGAVAISNQDAIGIDVALEKADAAMYSVKKQGKDGLEILGH